MFAINLKLITTVDPSSIYDEKLTKLQLDEKAGRIQAENVEKAIAILHKDPVLAKHLKAGAFNQLSDGYNAVASLNVNSSDRNIDVEDRINNIIKTSEFLECIMYVQVEVVKIKTINSSRFVRTKKEGSEVYEAKLV